VCQRLGRCGGVDVPNPARPLGGARLARVVRRTWAPPRAGGEVVARPTQRGDRCSSNGKPSSCKNFRDAPEKNRRSRAIRPKRPLTFASQDRWGYTPLYSKDYEALGGSYFRSVWSPNWSPRQRGHDPQGLRTARVVGPRGGPITRVCVGGSTSPLTAWSGFAAGLWRSSKRPAKSALPRHRFRSSSHALRQASPRRHFRWLVERSAAVAGATLGARARIGRNRKGASAAR
jgi:hypothetical protein